MLLLAFLYPSSGGEPPAASFSEESHATTQEERRRRMAALVDVAFPQPSETASTNEPVSTITTQEEKRRRMAALVNTEFLQSNGAAAHANDPFSTLSPTAAADLKRSQELAARQQARSSRDSTPMPAPVKLIPRVTTPLQGEKSGCPC